MIIDFHTHILNWSLISRRFAQEYLIKGYQEGADYLEVGPPPRAWEMMLQAGDLDLDQLGAMFLEQKTKAGIDLSVLFHVDAIASSQGAELDYQQANRWFAGFARANPDRIIAFAGIDPMRGEEGRAFLEICVRKLGLKGLKLHPVAGGFYPNDRSLYPYYETAQELGVPVLFHTGPSGGGRMSCGHPLLVDDVAADFPGLKIIIAHLQDPWLRECEAMVTWRANVYLDISAGQIMYRTQPERFFRRLKLLMRSSARKRLLFGTDTFSVLQSFVPDGDWVQIIKNLAQSEYAGDVPVEAQCVADLLGGNAQRLLGL